MSAGKNNNHPHNQKIHELVKEVFFPYTNKSIIYKRTCKVYDLSSPPLYHDVIDYSPIPSRTALRRIGFALFLDLIITA